MLSRKEGIWLSHLWELMELRNEMLLGMNDVSELTLGKRSLYSLGLFLMRITRHLARNDLGNNMRMLVMPNRQSQSSWTKRCFVASTQWLTLSHDSHWLWFTCSIFLSRICYHPFFTLVWRGLVALKTAVKIFHTICSKNGCTCLVQVHT